MTTIMGIVRKQYTWKVRLQDETGTQAVYPFSAYWDPAKVSLDEVAISAVAEANVISGKKHVPLGVELAA